MEFVVIECQGLSLLGCETAMSLGVLQIVKHVTDKQINVAHIMDKYSDLFRGLGKLKDYQLDICTDESVTPAILPFNKSLTYRYVISRS